MKKFTNVCLLIAFTFFSQLMWAQEICDNRIDDDGDGLIDCLDPDCSGDATCWECITEFYQVHSNTTMVSLDPVSGNYTTLATISGASQINGLQFNQIDGHVYAPTIINGAHKLGRLNSDGSVTDMGLSLPGNSIFYVGSIDASGVMYIARGGQNIYKIDLTAASLVAENTGVGFPGVADFALDITNGKFYGVAGGGKLKIYDPSAGTVNTFQLQGAIATDAGGYGAAWSCNDGSFFAYNNSSGKIYSIDVDNLIGTLVLNATGNLSINDGFNCVLSNPPFESNCADGIDEDGDGVADCADSDCYNSNVCIVEICDNGIDDDGDGWADCDDSECASLELCQEICDNGIDDNDNGLIDGDDPLCETSGGNDGGMESNRRLATKIAQRNFDRKLKFPELNAQKEAGDFPFLGSSSRNDMDIVNFIPSSMDSFYIADSSPQDLIGITNAEKVQAADYYFNDKRVGAILGIESSNGVYEHSKYICDRLDGSRLLDISYTYAKGGNFVTYEILNASKQMEYAVSFSAFEKGGEFYVENHWNMHKYSPDEYFYNFQIWANSYEMLIRLLESTLEELKEVAPIVSIEHSKVPDVFVSHGRYQNGSLIMTIKNKHKADHITVDGQFTQVENGEILDFTQNISLNGAKEQTVQIKTGYLYDIGFSIKPDEEQADEIFLADGSWGMDDDVSNLVDLIILPETNDYEAEEYPIERSIQARGKSDVGFNIYRSLNPKLHRQDLSDYNALSFNAKGQGQVEITLVKASIEDWEDQFKAQIVLGEEMQSFDMQLANFASKSGEELQLDDLTMIVFTLNGSGYSEEDSKLILEKLRFRIQSEQTLPIGLVESESMIVPNPVNSIATLFFDTSEPWQGSVNIINHIGQIIQTENVHAISGPNKKEINVTGLHAGLYYYQITNRKGLVDSGSFIKQEE